MGRGKEKKRKKMKRRRVKGDEGVSDRVGDGFVGKGEWEKNNNKRKKKKKKKKTRRERIGETRECQEGASLS